MKMSLNGNLILTPYRKTKELEATQVATGFAITKNKVGIESLELLVDTQVFLGDNSKELPKGTKVYFKESTLHVQQWPREIFEDESFPEGFVIGHINDVLFVEE